MADDFASMTEGLSDPADSLRAVTPSDSTDLTNIPKALYVGVQGDLSVIANDDADPVIIKNAVGIIPVRVKRVRATGTTATSIVALY